MKIGIESNLLKYYLQNVYFITGTAYAGKSTMVKMLAEKYDMIFCGENYHDVVPQSVLSPDKQPNLCYIQTMKDWQEFLNRTPEEYARWIDEVSYEAMEIEIAELLKLSADGRKIIVDTNIPVEVLKEISDYRRVAIMLSPQSMSVERFFEREDEEKKFILTQIQSASDPVKTMENFRKCIAMINSKERYKDYENSGFYTIVREDNERDTKQAVLAELARHFELGE